MASINVDLDYFNHPKTRKLVEMLGPGAAEIPLRLWAYCGKYHAKDGKLAGYTPAQLAGALGWTIAPADVIVTALFNSGFLKRNSAEEIVVNNFAEKQRHLHEFKRRAKHAAKSRWSKPKTVKMPQALPQALLGAEPCLEHAPSNALTVHSSTVHDVTDLTSTPTPSGGPQHAQDLKEPNAKPLNDRPSGETPPPAQTLQEPNNAPTALLTRRGLVDTVALLAQAKSMGGAIEVAPDYKKPDTPLQKLLLVVKQLQGFSLDNRDWDSVYFKRYARAAKDLLKFFGDDWQQAGTCAKDITAWLDGLGKPWTVETIVTHAPAWKSGNLGGKKLAK